MLFYLKWFYIMIGKILSFKYYNRFKLIVFISYIYIQYLNYLINLYIINNNFKKK